MELYGIEYQPEKVAGTILYTAKNKKYIGYIVISDELKEDTEKAIKNLKEILKDTVMLTGDSYLAAENIAEKIGINKFYAELLPDQKVEKLEELIDNKNKNKSVIFVGDGN